MFNPNPVIQILPIFEQQVCYLIDDALLEPERWCAEAIKLHAGFKDSTGHAYPGKDLPMSPSIIQAMTDYFMLHFKQRFGIRRMKASYGRLSMVTKAPHLLEPRQWICHRDRFKIQPNERSIASVLYLFANPELGGTNFFKPKQSALDTDTLVHDSSTQAANDFEAKYGLQAAYMTESSDYFEKVLNVPARWNRMIIYDGMVFHSGDIQYPGLMTDDPKTGRLSLNGFFRGQKNLA